MFLNEPIKKYSLTMALLAKVVDILLYLFSGLLVYYLSFSTFYLPAYYLISYIVAALLIVPIFSSFGVYASLRGRSFVAVYFKTLYPAFLVLMVSLAAIAFITKTGELYSRAWFLTWHAAAIFLLTLFRILLRQGLMYFRKRGFNHKKIVIIGESSLAHEIVKRTKSEIWIGFDVVSIIDQPDLEKLSHDIQNNSIDEVWLMLSKLTREQVREIVSSLHKNIITIRYFPDILGSDLFNHSFDEILGLPVINIIESPMRGINRVLKALEDYILATIILIIMSPLLLVIALLVKLSSPGPIFYRQKRISWNGKEFDILKFRSMKINSEEKTGAVWAVPDDKRTTAIGAFLRKTSIDELPQFINVLKGDMSIVGPRPERPVFVEQFKHEIPAYMQKHLVKAGITGWAQVNGWRGNTDLKKRLEHDLYYINHWSLWFDLKIIFLTFLRGFVHKNAY